MSGATSCVPPDRDCDTKNTMTSGIATWRRSPPMSNRSVSGCSRRSDPVIVLARQEVIANAQRAAVLEPGEWDHRVADAGGVDGEGADAVSPLERALRHIDVLHPRAGHVDHPAPEHPVANLDTVGIEAIARMAVRDHW